MTAIICGGVTPCLGVSMTSTAVVLGMAMLGTPEGVPDCGWAADAIGSIAMSKGVMNFIVFSSRCTVKIAALIDKSTLVLLWSQKKLPFREALDEEVPRLLQQPLTFFGVGNDADHHQHSRH